MKAHVAFVISITVAVTGISIAQEANSPVRQRAGTPGNEGKGASVTAPNAASSDVGGTLSTANLLGAISNTAVVRTNTIGSAGDVDMYRVEVRAGQQLGFDIDTPTNGPSGLGAYLRLFNAAGTEIAANNDRLAPGDPPPESGAGVNGFDSYIPYTFATAGSYYIGVTNWQNTSYNATSGAVVLGKDSRFLTGSYSLVVTQLDDYGNNCSTATTITVNGNRAGMIESAGDWDFFRVQMPAAGTLIVFTTGATDTYGYLKNSGCTDIASNDDSDYPSNLNFRIVQAVTAGTYYVAVRHYSSTGTGAYTVHVALAFNPATHTPDDDYTNHMGADYSRWALGGPSLGAGTAVVSPVTGVVRFIEGDHGYGTMAVWIEVPLSSARTFTSEYKGVSVKTNRVMVLFGHLRPSSTFYPGATGQARLNAGRHELGYNLGDTVVAGRTILGYLEQHPYEGNTLPDGSFSSSGPHVHVGMYDLNQTNPNRYAGRASATAAIRKQYIRPELAWSLLAN